MPKKPDLLKPRPARVLPADGKIPRQDTSLIPGLTGQSRAINFRCDGVTETDIAEHWDRLRSRAPYAAIHLSDVLRSLIQEGAESFRERFPETDNEET